MVTALKGCAGSIPARDKGTLLECSFCLKILLSLKSWGVIAPLLHLSSVEKERCCDYDKSCSSMRLVQFQAGAYPSVGEGQFSN